MLFWKMKRRARSCANTPCPASSRFWSRRCITSLTTRQGAASTLISPLREIVFGVELALLLPRFFRLDGLLYSFPIADALTFIIAAVIIRRTYRELT